MQRLTDARAIHAALSSLQVGEAVPTFVYIADEKDGTIPRWVVVHREDTSAGGVLLIVEDQTPRDEQPSLWEPDLRVRRGILTFDSRTLATQIYGQEGEPEWVAPESMLCSLVQQAKISGHRGKERKVAA